jgi:arsenate reductase-like glutaredoxin family protein
MKFIRCSKCKKLIGRIESNKIHPSEVDVLDLGMLMYPEVKLCEECFWELSDPYGVRRKGDGKKTG